jgi:hypothetical protein
VLLFSVCVKNGIDAFGSSQKIPPHGIEASSTNYVCILSTKVSISTLEAVNVETCLA